MKIAFSGDTLAKKRRMGHARGADLAIHECFLPNESFVTRYKFQPAKAIYVSTLVHTTAPVFGKIMAMTEPRHAVAYHFQNDPETLPEVVTAVRQTYDGPVDFAVDGMVWNITTEKIPTRVAMSWAQRLKRVFNIDIEICPNCGGAPRIIACIEDPVVIDKILTHSNKKGAWADPAALPQTRAPPQAGLFD